MSSTTRGLSATLSLATLSLAFAGEMSADRAMAQTIGGGGVPSVSSGAVTSGTVTVATPLPAGANMIGATQSAPYASLPAACASSTVGTVATVLVAAPPAGAPYHSITLQGPPASASNTGTNLSASTVWLVTNGGTPTVGGAGELHLEPEQFLSLGPQVTTTGSIVAIASAAVTLGCLVQP
ncbi:MAG: hypothetical protein ACRYHQ_14890 [Janthinobacterium lividum]